jgi:hypothetical protein
MHPITLGQDRLQSVAIETNTMVLLGSCCLPEIKIVPKLLALAFLAVRRN